MKNCKWLLGIQGFHYHYKCWHKEGKSILKALEVPVAVMVVGVMVF
jgi:hypothetical protein